jgi:hypothetical protein
MQPWSPGRLSAGNKHRNGLVSQIFFCASQIEKRRLSGFAKVGPNGGSQQFSGD